MNVFQHKSTHLRVVVMYRNYDIVLYKIQDTDTYGTLKSPDFESKFVRIRRDK